jgi:hypothetical protein
MKIGHRDVGPGLCQRDRDGSPDSAGRTGYESHFALQI